MNLFLWNIFLALAWAALNGRFSLSNLTLGFAIGFAVLAFVGPALGQSSYFDKTRQGLSLAAYFARELVVANFRVAHYVLTGRKRIQPGIVAVPLDVETQVEIMLLANLVALTPGTVILDISDDRKTLYVHAMYIEDPDSLRKEIKTGFERRVMELLR